jgi:hypothetical protein
MPFQPGQSGNPAGRPIGARNRKTLLMEALLEDDGEDLTRRLVEKALSGDATAMRLCMERLLPRMRERPIPFPLPRIGSPANARKAAAEIQGAVEAGVLTPREALDLLRVVDKLAHTVGLAPAKKQKDEKPEPRQITYKWRDGTLATLERQPDGIYRTVSVGKWELDPDGTYRTISTDVSKRKSDDDNARMSDEERAQAPTSEPNK